MGYQVFDQNIQGQFRLSGYGVPAYCDYPGCSEKIDRGMGYACCGAIHHSDSCGGFYCANHSTPIMSENELEDLDEEEKETVLASYGLTEAPLFDENGIAYLCSHPPIEFKEHPDWIKHISKDKSWSKFRKEEHENFNALKALEKKYAAE